MLVKYNCEKCGVEKEVDLKVPKFCGSACRLQSLRERKRTATSKTETPMEVVPEVPTELPIQEIVVPETLNNLEENVNIAPEVTGEPAVVSTPEASGDITVQQ